MSNVGIRQILVLNLLMLILMYPAAAALHVAIDLADDPNYHDDPYGILAKMIAQKQAKGEKTAIEATKALDEMGMVYEADNSGEIKLVKVKPAKDKED